MMEIDEGFDAVAVALSVTVAIAVVVAVLLDLTMTGAAATVDVIITVAVSVLSGDVEPDVRLKITSPASIKNGDELPLVLVRQVLLNGFTLPQQNNHLPLTSTRLIDVAPLRLTAVLISA